MTCQLQVLVTFQRDKIAVSDSKLVPSIRRYLIKQKSFRPLRKRKKLDSLSFIFLSLIVNQAKEHSKNISIIRKMHVQLITVSEQKAQIKRFWMSLILSLATLRRRKLLSRVHFNLKQNKDSERETEALRTMLTVQIVI